MHTPHLSRVPYVLLSVILTTAVGTSTAGAETPAKVRVMTWNIRYANPRDGKNAWKHRKDWVAEVIARQKVDVVGLQEVLSPQLHHLQKRLTDYASYGVGRDDGKSRGEYAPIFYRQDRFTLLDKGTFWLSRTPDKVGSKDWDAAITRIASWVQLRDKKTKQTLFVVNTHFDHRGRQARANSAKLLVERLRTQFKDHPVVLTGDFNTLPGSAPYKTLVGSPKDKKRVFHDARGLSNAKPEGPNSTWSGFRAGVANRRIDFIMTSNNIRVLTHRTLAEQRDGRFASDHLAVVSDLTLSEE